MANGGWLRFLVISALLAAPGAAEAQVFKGGMKKGIPSRRPGRVVEQWNRMSPAERQRMMSKLPPERRRQLQERLREYNELGPEERQRLQDRYAQFRQLPPEKQEAMRRVFRRSQLLPDERRHLVQNEMRSLGKLTEDERWARVESEEFRERFNAAEQQLMWDYVRILPPPKEEQKDQ